MVDHTARAGAKGEQVAVDVDDERWMLLGGRRWRRTDPALPDDVVAALTSHLGRGRSAVRIARREEDADALAAARARVDLAKHGLGERGPYWWEQAEADRIRNACDILDRLEGLDAGPRSPGGATTPKTRPSAD